MDSKRAPILAQRFRTAMCRNWEKTGRCPYEAKCMFAHGEAQLRTSEQNVEDGLVTENAIRSFKKVIPPTGFARHTDAAFERKRQQLVARAQGRMDSPASSVAGTVRSFGAHGSPFGRPRSPSQCSTATVPSTVPAGYRCPPPAMAEARHYDPYDAQGQCFDDDEGQYELEDMGCDQGGFNGCDQGYAQGFDGCTDIPHDTMSTDGPYGDEYGYDMPPCAPQPPAHLHIHVYQGYHGPQGGCPPPQHPPQHQQPRGGFQRHAAPQQRPYHQQQQQRYPHQYPPQAPQCGQQPRFVPCGVRAPQGGFVPQ